MIAPARNACWAASARSRFGWRSTISAWAIPPWTCFDTARSTRSSWTKRLSTTLRPILGRWRYCGPCWRWDAVLSIEVLAEGIETERQLAILQAEGCVRIQGYLTGRPVPADRIEFDIQRRLAS